MAIEGDLLRGVAEPIILKLISNQAMYGYEIIKVVNERSRGAFEWKEGTLYPCLHRLEGAGFISSSWMKSESGKDRKYYHITSKGEALFREKVIEWGSFAAAVNSLLHPELDHTIVPV